MARKIIRQKKKMKEVPLIIKHKYPGSWLYSRKILEWLFIPVYRNQLPILFRFFGIISKLYFRISDNDYFIYGRSLFLLFCQLNKRIFHQEFCKFELVDFKIYLDLTDPRFLNVVNEMIHQKTDTRILSYLLNEGDTFIDVGANHGSFSIIASKYVGVSGLIIAVEPQPRLVKALRKSLSENGFSDFRIYETALGDQNGHITFIIPNDTTGSAGVFSAHSGTGEHKKIGVPINRFDDLITEEKFTGKIIIKLDIEGSEYAFLLGARKFIYKLKPVLVFEINPQSLVASNTSGLMLLQLLQELGYKWFSELPEPTVKIALENINLNHFRNVIFYVDNNFP